MMRQQFWEIAPRYRYRVISVVLTGVRFYERSCRERFSGRLLCLPGGGAGEVC